MDSSGLLNKPEVAVGDRVMFNAYAGSEVKTADEQAEYLVMSSDDILGVLV